MILNLIQTPTVLYIYHNCPYTREHDNSSSLPSDHLNLVIYLIPFLSFSLSLSLYPSIYFFPSFLSLFLSRFCLPWLLISCISPLPFLSLSLSPKLLSLPPSCLFDLPHRPLAISLSCVFLFHSCFSISLSSNSRNIYIWTEAEAGSVSLVLLAVQVNVCLCQLREMFSMTRSFCTWPEAATSRELFSILLPTHHVSMGGGHPAAETDQQRQLHDFNRDIIE